MGKKKDRFLSDQKLSEVLNAYASDPLNEKDEKFKQSYKEYRKSSNQIMRTLIGAGSTYKDHLDEPVAGEIAEAIVLSPGLFDVQILPSAKDIQSRIEAYSDSDYLKKHNISEDEAKNMISKYKAFLPYVPQTAYITPKWNEKLKQLTYMIAIGKDFHDELKNLYPDNEAMRTRALVTTVLHEYQHFRGGDIVPAVSETRKEQYPHISPDVDNVIGDMRINSYLLSDFPKDSAALLDKIGIRGSTIKQFLPQTYLLQAIHETYSKNKIYDRESLNEEELNHLSFDIADNFASITKSELGKEMHIEESFKSQKELMDFVKQAFENLKKAGIKDDIKAYFKPESDSLRKKIDADINLKIAPPDLMSEVASFRDINNLLQSHLTRYEQHASHNLYMEDYRAIVDKMLGLLPSRNECKPGEDCGQGKGNRNGKGEGNEPGKPINVDEPPMPSEDDPMMTEVGEDELNADDGRQARVANEVNNQIDDKLKQAGKGHTSIDQQLKYDPDRRFKQVIEEAIRRALADIAPEKKRVIRPMINMPLQVVKRNKETGNPVKGIRMIKTKKSELPNIMFAVFDESGSVSSKDLSKAKSALVDICSEENTVVIGFSMTSDPSKAQLSVFDPRNPKTIEGFMKRFATGGTQGFHHLILDFDDLAKNQEFTKNIDNALREADVRTRDKDGNEELMTHQHLLQAFNEGKLRGIVVTDGFLPREQLTPDQKEKYLKYAQKIQDVPISYVSTTGHIDGPFQDSELQMKVYDWFSI